MNFSTAYILFLGATCIAGTQARLGTKEERTLLVPPDDRCDFNKAGQQACCSQSDCPDAHYCLGASLTGSCSCSGEISGNGACFKSREYFTDGKDIPITLPSGGLMRTAEVHLPPPALLSQSMPLVINIHAMGQDITSHKDMTNFNELADKEGFVVLYPQGYTKPEFTAGDVHPDGFTFNGGSCCMGAIREKIDDVGFIRDLVQFVSNNLGGPRQDFGIDRRRIYATGYSNGGFMSYRLAREASDMLAAIAPVAGVMSEDSYASIWPEEDQDPYFCNPESPVSVLHIHDRTDPLVPFSYSDGWFSPLNMGWPSVPSNIDSWRRFNGVYDRNDKGVITFTNGTSSLWKDCVVCTSYGSTSQNVTLCEESADCLLTDPNIPHTWPGNTAFGGSKYFQATEQIWEFFKNNPKQMNNGHGATSAPGGLPNPFNDHGATSAPGGLPNPFNGPGATSAPGGLPNPFN